MLNQNVFQCVERISGKVFLAKYFFIAAMWGILLTSGDILAEGYYVDSKNGNDVNTGKSEKTPWKTLQRVNDHSFIPGDSIFFRRGSSWSGELTINHSGLPESPIVFTAYGKGNNPLIKNPGVQRGSVIRILADYVVIENFNVKEAHEAGINIMQGSDYNIIQNNEASLCGMGIAVRGKHNLVTGNYTHDLKMIVNDEGGDNDFGAVGVWLFNSNNEVSYNRMFKCKAPSLDYGHDGGVVEFYGDVDSCYVHHNWGELCDGAFEVGGREDTVSGNLIAYNVFINNGIAGGFHVGGKFGVYLEAFHVENNLFIETGERDYAIGFWNGTPSRTSFQCRNNIFYIPHLERVSSNPDFVHEHNLYYLGNKTDIGTKLGPGDIIGDPRFVDLNKKDFHLQPDSPAIDAGIDLQHQTDFDGNTVPNGSSPDIGPFEYIRSE